MSIVVTSLTTSLIRDISNSINYSISNSTPSSLTSYLYRYGSTSSIPTAPTILDASGTFITQVTTAAGGVSTSTFSNGGLTSNNSYTYAFYNGQVNGSSAILLDPSGNPKSASSITYGTISTLSIGRVSNNATTINYTIQNGLSTVCNTDFYRFVGPTAPLTNPTSGFRILRLTISAGVTRSGSINAINLSANTQYTYAFYNGQNAIATILRDATAERTVQSITSFTTNIYNPSLTAPSISTSSVSIDYTLNNNPSSKDVTVYLYRFTGESAPSILTGGTSISGGIFVSAGTTPSSSITDSTVVLNNTYTYAFYNGLEDDSSNILQNNSTDLSDVSLTVQVFYDIVQSLSTSGTTFTSTNINYSVKNPLTTSNTCYLFRFLGNITAPSPLNTSLTGATNVTSISVNGNSTNTSSYNDTTLRANNIYTYALYNGTSSGSSLLLTDASATPVQTNADTGGVSPPVTYDISAFTYRNTGVHITLVATDPQGYALTYYYTSPSNGHIIGTAPNLLYYPNYNYSGPDSFTYYAQNIYDISSNTSTVTISVSSSDPPCFKEGSKILCFNKKEEKEEYIPIQHIRKGTLVKTELNGYLPVDMIGWSTIYNSGDDVREKNRLYACRKEHYPEIIEELVITGYHSILVDEFNSVEQREKTIQVNGDTYVTGDKYRLPACVDERAIPYEIEGEFTIWHLALENDNYYYNYGIYANGLLVESCSKRFLKELSKMTLVE